VTILCRYWSIVLVCVSVVSEPKIDTNTNTKFVFVSMNTNRVCGFRTLPIPLLNTDPYTSRLKSSLYPLHGIVIQGLSQVRSVSHWPSFKATLLANPSTFLSSSSQALLPFNEHQDFGGFPSMSMPLKNVSIYWIFAIVDCYLVPLHTFTRIYRSTKGV
jgi:hypothetical protein